MLKIVKSTLRLFRVKMGGRPVGCFNWHCSQHSSEPLRIRGVSKRKRTQARVSKNRALWSVLRRRAENAIRIAQRQGRPSAKGRLQCVKVGDVVVVTPRSQANKSCERTCEVSSFLRDWVLLTDVSNRRIVAAKLSELRTPKSVKKRERKIK